jgi:hypothetical protein
MPTSQAPAHWSKDFVEHLRLVHFTLVAVSVAIVIIVKSANPYKPAVAVRELHQIVELKKLWSLQWIRDHSDHDYIAYDSNQKDHVNPSSESGNIDFTTDSITLEAVITWPKVDYDDIELFILPQASWTLSDPPHKPHKLVNPRDFPTQLSEFEQWWMN